MADELSERENRIKDVLMGIVLADHLGDVNNELPELCELLGQPEPEWNDEKRRYVFPWETTDA